MYPAKESSIKYVIHALIASVIRSWKCIIGNSNFPFARLPSNNYIKYADYLNVKRISPQGFQIRSCTELMEMPLTISK